jgi:hypothetical protein
MNPLYSCLYKNYFEIAKILLDNGAKASDAIVNNYIIN